jgi:hypothetical protein
MCQIMARARGNPDLVTRLEREKPTHTRDALSTAARLLEAGRTGEVCS